MKETTTRSELKIGEARDMIMSGTDGLEKLEIVDYVDGLDILTCTRDQVVY